MGIRDVIARVWLDDDGKHVWLRHDCDRGGPQDTMLPWPKWQAVSGKVEPSIVCSDCGLHLVGAKLEAPTPEAPTGAAPKQETADA